MPTSRRDAIKRKHSAIANSLDKSLYWTEELFTMFEKHHTDYADAYAIFHTNIEQCKEFIIKLRGFI